MAGSPPPDRALVPLDRFVREVRDGGYELARNFPAVLATSSGAVEVHVQVALERAAVWHSPNYTEGCQVTRFARFSVDPDLVPLLGAGQNPHAEAARKGRDQARRHTAALGSKAGRPVTSYLR